MICSLDLLKSAGPATCFIVEYEKEAELKRIAGSYFHEVIITQRSN